MKTLSIARFARKDEACTFWENQKTGTTEEQAIARAQSLDCPPGEYHEVHRCIDGNAEVIWIQGEKQ